MKGKDNLAQVAVTVPFCKCPAVALPLVWCHFSGTVFLAELESQDILADPQQWETITIVNWGDRPSEWNVSRTACWLLATGAFFLRELDQSIPQGVWSSSVWSAAAGDCIFTGGLPTHTGGVPETGQEEGGRRKRDYHSSEETKTYQRLAKKTGWIITGASSWEIIMF